MDRKQRAVNIFQRRFANPIRCKLPNQELLETTGRISGQPRITPIGGKLIDNSFWMVTEFGDRSQYVRNIMANNSVRLRLRGEWHRGTAILMPERDPLELLDQLPRSNSLGVRMLGNNLLSLRIDLE
ncbi:nitroreductase/quinone reductase family protein [Nocardia altamirensis]|uniref:nitroreductase/quinone reductase family protein n=1 Tax=Nocardia altamirensis TaxID=472158 RepID=UPI001FDF5324|nr:nitroreductase/quinone reductase family protein [Nocardia altamirensis]